MHLQDVHAEEYIVEDVVGDGDEHGPYTTPARPLYATSRTPARPRKHPAKLQKNIRMQAASLAAHKQRCSVYGERVWVAAAQ